MATERYKRYARNKYKEWAKRVNEHLPHLAIKLYTYELSGHRVEDYRKRLLGAVIEAINNPYHTLIDHTGKRSDYTNEMAAEIILQIQVNDLFSYIKKIP